MTAPEGSPTRIALRDALTQAMKDHDSEAAGVYRAAMAAIDNAGAQPLGVDHHAGALEESPVGVGAAEVPRNELSEPEIIEVVRGEQRERELAADALADKNPEAAQQLRAGAALLTRFLGKAGTAER